MLQPDIIERLRLKKIARILLVKKLEIQQDTCERDDYTQPDHHPVELFSALYHVLRIHLRLLHRALARRVSRWRLNIAGFY